MNGSFLSYTFLFLQYAVQNKKAGIYPAFLLHAAALDKAVHQEQVDECAFGTRVAVRVEVFVAQAVFRGDAPFLQVEVVGGRADEGENDGAVAHQVHFVAVEYAVLADGEFNAVFDAVVGAVVFGRGGEGFPAHGVVAGKTAFLVEHVEVFADALADARRVDLDVFVNVARRAVA